jgi:hypothetical protein
VIGDALDAFQSARTHGDEVSDLDRVVQSSMLVMTKHEDEIPGPWQRNVQRRDVLVLECQPYSMTKTSLTIFISPL